MSQDKDLLRRQILEQGRWTLFELADEIQLVDLGWLARTHSLPLVHTLNQLHVAEPAAAEEVVELAERLQHDLPYRHIVVDHEDTGHQLADTLARQGWRVERELLMGLGAGPNRQVDTGAITELSEDETSALMRQWAIEDHLDTHEGALDQLDEYSRREGRLWSERCYGVKDADGRAAAVTKLRHRAGVAWVEDVYTRPDERRKGHARMLVTEAAAEARRSDPEFTFIVADDNDWPKHLYADIGFEPVGRTWSFHREVAQER